MLRQLKLLLPLCCAFLFAGCGNSVVLPPDLTTPQQPKAFVVKEVPEVGVSLNTPKNWHFQEGIAPRVFSYWSGSASLTVWRFQRSEPLPTTKKELTESKTALENAIKARNASFAPTLSQVKKISPKVFAIELVGTALVEGKQTKVRSLHLFTAGSEIVLDAVAPATDFDRIDQLAFTEIINSVAVSSPKKSAPSQLPNQNSGQQNQQLPNGQSLQQTSPFSSPTPNSSAGTP